MKFHVVKERKEVFFYRLEKGRGGRGGEGGRGGGWIEIRKEVDVDNG